MYLIVPDSVAGADPIRHRRTGRVGGQRGSGYGSTTRTTDARKRRRGLDSLVGGLEQQVAIPLDGGHEKTALTSDKR